MITLCELCGTAVSKMNLQACSCQKFINTNVTNEQNVRIAEIICIAIVVIAAIAALTLLLYHLIANTHESRKAAKNRDWELEDQKLKQKADYQSKLLDHKKNDLNDFEKVLKKIKDLTDKNSIENPTDDEIKKMVGFFQNQYDAQKNEYISKLNDYIKELRES